MEYDSYRKGIMPHVEWLKQQINESKNEFIIIKISDLRIVMGDNFNTQSDRVIYSSLRDILLENGIKIYGKTHNDGSKMLQMEIAKEDEIITSAEARRMRSQKTAAKQGFNATGEYKNYTIYKRGLYQSESDTKTCPRYFGEYIEREYVSQIFEDPILFERIGIQHETKKYDFECKNGFKLKHIASCLRVDEYHVLISGEPIPYYGFSIKNNNVPDYYILSAWDNRESLRPKYVWIMKSDEIFVTQKSQRPFWDRAIFVVYATRKGIDRMSKYEATDKLEQLKDICNIARKEE